MKHIDKLREELASLLDESPEFSLNDYGELFVELAGGIEVMDETEFDELVGQYLKDKGKRDEIERFLNQQSPNTI